MNKFVVEIHIDEPYVASWTHYIALEFDGSLEELEMEWEIAAEKCRGKQYFKFQNIKICQHERPFYFKCNNQQCYSPPWIYTLDEWFEKKKKDHPFQRDKN